MRGRPPRRERVLGGVLLAIVGLVAVLCLASTGYLGEGIYQSLPIAQAKSVLGMPTQPLFTADPKHMKSTSATHAMQIAENMLPAEANGWRREQVQVTALRAMTQPAGEGLRLDAFPEGLAEGAEAFNGLTLYRASYVGPEQGGPVEVCIVDTHEPANAFGLWRSREPQEAKAIVLGRGGWQVPSAGRLGVWAGRYYTEMAADGSAAAADVDNLARVLIGLQLAYGGPFWAERVLPTDQRVERSFRYVYRSPWGLDALSESWLADYPDGLTVGVMRPPVQQAAKVLGDLTEQLEAAPAAGAEEQEQAESGADEYAAEPSEPSEPAAESASVDLPPDAVVGRVNDRTVAAFRAGEYLFVAAAPEAATVSQAAQKLMERWAAQPSQAVSTPPVPDSAVASGQAGFADLGDANIQTPTKVERYTDNLYEKINGREPQFRAFNFVELRWGQYLDSQRQAAFDVYIYDMAEPANAFGIYMKERSGEVQEVQVGRGGYASGSSIFFWKGRYYVCILGPPESQDGDADISQRIASAIAGTIADDGQTFWGEALLPAKDRKPNSFTYLATSVLGFNFLERAFTASYQTAGGEYQLFVLKADDPPGAQKMFEQYADTTAKYDQVVSRQAAGEGCRMVSESLKIYAVVFCKGNYLAGVIECEDQALAEQAADAFREALP